MRVAVHFPDDHPNHPGAVTAYKLGRIEDGVHNHVWHTGQTTPLQEFVDGLIDSAKAEFPDGEVVLERLVHNPDWPGESMWIRATDLDESVHVPVGPGLPAPEPTVHVDQAVETAEGGN